MSDPIAEWIARIQRFYRAATIQPRFPSIPAPRLLQVDHSGRLVAWAYNWEDPNGISIADLSDGRILFNDPDHRNLHFFPLQGGFASLDFATRRVLLVRIDAEGRVDAQFSAAIGEAASSGSLSVNLLDVSRAGDRLLLWRNSPLVETQILVWPSCECVARFAGYRQAIDWDARRILCVEGGRLVFRAFDGSDTGEIAIDPRMHPQLALLSPGLWARHGKGLGLLEVLAARDLPILPASPGHFRAPSLSADGRAVRVSARGKAYRIPFDLLSSRVELPPDLLRMARTRGTEEAVFHPVVDLVADGRRGAIRRLDGSLVLLLEGGWPRAWTKDGMTLLATREGRIDIWRDRPP